MFPLAIHVWFINEKVKRAISKLLEEKRLSHQNVIRISSKIVEGFNKWKRRDLSELRVVYLILKGIRLGVRAGTRQKEAVHGRDS